MEITHTIKDGIFRIEVQVSRHVTRKQFFELEKRIYDYIKPFLEQYKFDSSKVKRHLIQNMAQHDIYIEEAPVTKKTKNELYMECLEVFLES